MSARGIPIRSQGRPAGRVDSPRSAKPSRLQTPKPQPTNGDTVFDPQAFLARAGLGRKIFNLKKNDTAYAQGDPTDAIFYVQTGRLRITITSANGKEATLALVGAGYWREGRKIYEQR